MKNKDGLYCYFYNENSVLTLSLLQILLINRELNIFILIQNILKNIPKNIFILE